MKPLGHIVSLMSSIVTRGAVDARRRAARAAAVRSAAMDASISSVVKAVGVGDAVRRSSLAGSEML